jgi:hypothetical protein
VKFSRFIDLLFFHIPKFEMSMSARPASERFVFTVSTGRCGQASLTQLVRAHVHDCYAAFEEPSIKPVLPGRLEPLERRFRRKFFESDEMLGRGRTLNAYDAGDMDFIEKITIRRLADIRRKLADAGSHNYFDISKFFGRSLHAGFTETQDQYALVNLVRDPVANMRSYLNRNKTFALDNSLPDSDGNILQMESASMNKGELYLWSWFEMNLRFDALRQSKKVTHCVEIRTEHLSDADRMNSAFNVLELDHSPVVRQSPQNTNLERGYAATRLSTDDIEVFERFMARVPGELCRRIAYLDDYDPRSVHLFSQVAAQ